MLFLTSIALAALPPVVAALFVAPCQCAGLAEALPIAVIDAPAGIVLYLVGRRAPNNRVAYWTAAGAMIATIVYVQFVQLTPASGEAALGNIFWGLAAPVVGMVAAVAGWILSAGLADGLDRRTQRPLAFLIFVAIMTIPSVGVARRALTCEPLDCPERWTSPLPPPH